MFYNEGIERCEQIKIKTINDWKKYNNTEMK